MGGAGDTTAGTAGETGSTGGFGVTGEPSGDAVGTGATVTSGGGTAGTAGSTATGTTTGAGGTTTPSSAWADGERTAPNPSMTAVDAMLAAHRLCCRTRPIHKEKYPLLCTAIHEIFK